MSDSPPPQPPPPPNPTPQQLWVPSTNGGSRVPIPDPSTRTVEDTEKAVGNLRELLETKVQALDNLREAKVEVVDARQTGERHVQAEIIKGLHREVALRESHRLELKIVEREHRLELKEADAKALSAALAAAEKRQDEIKISGDLAIARQDSATADAIKALDATTRTAAEGVNNQLRSLEARVGSIEAVKVGQQEAGVQQIQKQDRTGMYLAIAVSAVVGFLLIALAAAALLINNSSP